MLVLSMCNSSHEQLTVPLLNDPTEKLFLSSIRNMNRTELKEFCTYRDIPKDNAMTDAHLRDALRS